MLFLVTSAIIRKDTFIFKLIFSLENNAKSWLPFSLRSQQIWSGLLYVWLCVYPYRLFDCFRHWYSGKNAVWIFGSTRPLVFRRSSCSVKQPWWSLFSFYFQACFAQLFYRELVSVKRNFTADAAARIFQNFQSTSRRLVRSPSIVALHPGQQWFKGTFLNVLNEFFEWYQCMW